MAKIEIVTRETAEWTLPAAGARGPVGTFAYFDQPAHSLRLRLHELAAEAALDITAQDTDLLVYVWRGAVNVRGVLLEPRSSLIIERGGSAELEAAAGAATVLVFSTREQAAQRSAPTLQLLPRARVPATRDLGGQGTAGGALHADASRPGAPVWLHENEFYESGFEVAVHSHSEDEIIFVQAGELHLGDRCYGPGTALAIAANGRYGFRAGPEGLSFVNFRAGPPTYTSHDGKHSMDEAEFWRGATGRPEPLELPCA